eukprot:gnl/TRDRNA2_/TRDRNA2_136266_c0_seq1.p1 gnl/TRDRNA2_/TRDRNA2_136266_c0~~gnl/TRDRNA2_/TRDRNA2_136266_c0_seq1.p1  ORF type:complete len:143 (-),score=28.79 gnl/TRDRNA2_/TRDRNA2_136266_c0_seq1:90-518(-)
MGNSDSAPCCKKSPVVENVENTATVTAAKSPKEDAAKAASEVVPADPPQVITPRGQFMVTLRRTNATDVLGIDVNHSDKITLLVDRVKDEGLVPDWNKSNPDRAIRPGDRIISVNGVAGKAMDMLEATRGASVELVLKSGGT